MRVDEIVLHVPRESACVLLVVAGGGAGLTVGGEKEGWARLLVEVEVGGEVAQEWDGFANVGS
jgi:hypothetical protein